MRRLDLTLIGAVSLGAIAAGMIALIGGVRLHPDHVAAGAGDVPSGPPWTLEVFGVPVTSGIHSQPMGFGLALLAFAVVGGVIGGLLIVLVRRWRPRPS